MIWIGAIMCVVGGVAQLSGSAGPMQKGLVLVLLVGGAGFLLWMLYGTSYTFSPGGLHHRRTLPRSPEGLAPPRDRRARRTQTG